MIIIHDIYIAMSILITNLEVLSVLLLHLASCSIERSDIFQQVLILRYYMLLCGSKGRK